MANAVREDVVKVSFDVDDKPLQKVDSGIDNLVHSMSNMAGAGGVGGITKGFQEIAKSASSMNKVATTADNITSSIEEFNARAAIAKEKLTGIKNAVAGVVAHPIKTLDNYILGIQMGAGRAAAELRRMAATKVDQLKTNISNIKNALTEGQTGARGFATAFKNIGKVSLMKLVNGVNTLTTNLKSKAPAAAQKLKTHLTTIAKVAMDKVVSGVKKLGSGLKSALGTAGKLAVKLGSFAVKGLVAGVAGGIAALGALGASAIKAYGEYEQLVGGVETLFGKDAYNTVVKNANNAYKTAGLSANQYMETVTGFSASLLQSLGGDTNKAAQYADMAVTDMADNANKMGTDMSSIQNAYQGFAKQNYTMLDNLKLGYGGTKEEMQRLLKDAEKISGKKFDISNYADVVEAIHVIQDNMGIAGATAQEASSTIQGSFNSMKSAWTNFITGLADPNQDLDLLIGNLIDSVVTFGNNVIPRIQMMLPRLITGISQLAQSIATALPGLLNSLLPPLVQGAISLVSSLVSTLQANAGTLTSTAIDLVMQLIAAIFQMLPQVISTGGQILMQLCLGIAQQLPSLIQMAVDLIVTLANGLLANLDNIINCALQLMTSLCQGLLQALPQLLMAAMQLIIGLAQGILGNLPTIIQTGMELVVSLIQGIVQAIPQIAAMIPQLVVTIIEGLFSIDWLQVGWDLIKAILKGVWDGAVGLVTGLWDGIKGLFSDGGKEAGEAASEGIATGLDSSSYTPTAAATNVASSTTTALGSASNTYGIGAAANTNLASGLNAYSYAPVSAAANTEGMTDNELARLSSGTSQYGAQAATNLASGISSNTGTAVSAATSMSSQVENAASSEVTVKVVGEASSMSGFTAQITNLVAQATAKLEGIPTAFTNAFNQAAEATTAAMSAVEAAFTAGMDKLTTASETAMQTVTASMQAGMQMVVTIVSSTNLYNSGVFVMQGLVRGMQSQLPAVIAAATAAANAIKRATDKALDINSPSGEMEKRGIFTGQGQAVGMVKSIPDIKLAAREVSNASIPYDTYSPESASYSYGGNSEYTTISPQFNLTISGTQDDRATARRVKRYVAEAIADTFESMERKNRSYREA